MADVSKMKSIKKKKVLYSGRNHVCWISCFHIPILSLLCMGGYFQFYTLLGLPQEAYDSHHRGYNWRGSKMKTSCSDLVVIAIILWAAPVLNPCPMPRQVEQYLHWNHGSCSSYGSNMEQLKLPSRDYRYCDNYLGSISSRWRRHKTK